MPRTPASITGTTIGYSRTGKQHVPAPRPHQHSRKERADGHEAEDAGSQRRHEQPSQPEERGLEHAGAASGTTIARTPPRSSIRPTSLPA